MDPLKFVKDNTYGINQLNISPNKKVDKLLVRFAGICGAIAVQPIPFADIFILTPIQLYMGTLIAEARGYKFSMSEIYKEILSKCLLKIKENIILLESPHFCRKVFYYLNELKKVV